MIKKIFTLAFLAAGISAGAQQLDYSYAIVPFTKVKVHDTFWLPRIKTNHLVTIPASFKRCEETGRIKNFEMAAARSGKFCTAYVFDDTDIYKTIEGASFSMSLYPDKKLDQYIDSLIAKVAAAQEPDGYLYTARTINPASVGSWVGKERWEKEREMSHELYNSGHLYEAAVAHYQSTGKKNLLNIAIRNADLVCSVFGPGKRHVAPGHEVVEMGLVKMYRVTGKKEYLETAKDFIDERGRYKGYDPKSKDPFKNGAYWQDHVPVVDQTEANGHAVRAGYLYSAMADVAALTGDAKLIKAIDTIWNNVVTKKIYVQGGVGAVGDGERYGNNYELPNSSAYNETCAQIASVYWNHRMFLLHGDSKYIDILEKTLYNGLISGVGMDGNSFFYTNAMEIRNGHQHADMEAGRSGWFTCSCCPTNVTRLIPSIPGYAYAQKNNAVFVNLFMSSTTSLTVGNKSVTIEQENDYPWNGLLKFTVTPATSLEFSLNIRIPGWARNEAMPSNLYTFASPSTQKAEIKINGKTADYSLSHGYAILTKVWKRGDVVEVNLPMEVRRVVANEKISDDIGKVALQRGPIMFCAEWPDNFGRACNIVLPPETKFTAEFKKDLLNGVTLIKGEARVVEVNPEGTNVTTTHHPFTAIPYYAWAHRGKGEMEIWFPTTIRDVEILSR